MTRILKYSEAILEATSQAMEEDPLVYVIGLGATDPKGIFGTTLGLEEKFGSKRVMDMPTSENAMTGIAIGSAIKGMRPIMTHQRSDFMLLAFDQLINNAAKWHFMFNGQMKVPLVIRLIIGRGWGQGPQHSQSLQAFFARVPGIKVVAPAFANDAKGLLLSAIRDNNPVIYLEHRWLHNSLGSVEEESFSTPIGKARIVEEGTDITVVASSHMTIEAMKASESLKKAGVSVDLVDLRSLKPLDIDTIISSVKKTGKLLVLDGDWKMIGIASEIITQVTECGFQYLKSSPQRLTFPDQYVPTTPALANQYYPTCESIVGKICDMLAIKQDLGTILSRMTQSPLDVPDVSFMGPF